MNRSTTVGRTRLIALTVVAVAILGIRFVQARMERADVMARRAALLGDLRRLGTAQNGYYARHGEFAATLTEPDLAFSPSPTIVLRFERVAPDAWQGVAHDPELRVAPTSCGVFEGPLAASPHRSLLEASVPGCW